MKIYNMRYDDIQNVVNYLGDKLSLTLTQHALTDCDTTSYLYGAEKVKVRRKCMKNSAVVELIEPIGKTCSFLKAMNRRLRDLYK